MIANSDLIDMNYAADGMGVVQDNPWAMLDVYQEMARVAGSEIAHGPVPAGSTATEAGRLGRSLRRTGTNLNAAVASKNAGATMRTSNIVQRSMTMAGLTNRPNMKRLLRLTAMRAHQTARMNSELANEEQLRLQREEQLAMKRRLAILAGAGAAGAANESTRNLYKGMGGMFGSKVTAGAEHVLCHILVERAFHGVTPQPHQESLMTRVTSPVRGIIDRVMGREGQTREMGMSTPAFEMSLPQPDAPTPTAPRMSM